MITLLVTPGELAAREIVASETATGGTAAAELVINEVVVSGTAYRHLFRARRLASGDRVRVTDGEGRARWGEVGRVERARAVVVLGGAAPANLGPLRRELLVATLRPERAAWLVEKATELGVAAVRFLHSERAPRGLGAGALDRLRRVAAAALEQSHGSRLPELSGPHAWEAVPALGGGERWVLDTEAESGWPAIAPAAPAAPAAAAPPSAASPAPATSESAASPAPASPAASLLVGPEGGWAPAERQALAAAGWRAVGFGPRTLRSETAAIAGAALLLLPHPLAPRSHSPPTAASPSGPSGPPPVDKAGFRG